MKMQVSLPISYSWWNIEQLCFEGVDGWEYDGWPYYLSCRTGLNHGLNTYLYCSVLVIPRALKKSSTMYHNYTFIPQFLQALHLFHSSWWLHLQTDQEIWCHELPWTDMFQTKSTDLSQQISASQHTVRHQGAGCKIRRWGETTSCRTHHLCLGRAVAHGSKRRKLWLRYRFVWK